MFSRISVRVEGDNVWYLNIARDDIDTFKSLFVCDVVDCVSVTINPDDGVDEMLLLVESFLKGFKFIREFKLVVGDVKDDRFYILSGCIFPRTIEIKRIYIEGCIVKVNDEFVDVEGVKYINIFHTNVTEIPYSENLYKIEFPPGIIPNWKLPDFYHDCIDMFNMSVLHAYYMRGQSRAKSARN